MVLAEAAYDSMFTAKDTGYMDVNVKAISEDTTAADNAESFFDGTGYAGTNNVIPTVTTVSGVGSGAITSASFGAGAIDAAAIANSAIDAATFAAGAIDAAAIATGAIDADALAADAVNEIWAKSITEPTGAFAWSDTVLDIVEWLGIQSRNKITQTSTTTTIRNDADGADVSTSTISDNGTTFTRGEFT